MAQGSGVNPASGTLLPPDAIWAPASEMTALELSVVSVARTTGNGSWILIGRLLVPYPSGIVVARVAAVPSP